MKPKASTFRIDPTIQAALESLSKILRRPMNQLVNAALEDYVKRRSQEVEQDLEATLARLRAHRHRDPHFKAAISAFVEAEARMGREDPAEGKAVIGKLVDGRLVENQQPADASSPIQEQIRRLLNA
jgi:predicted transcriptional regulator